jgi:hypothetical protein
VSAPRPLSPDTIRRRLTAVESRVADIEDQFGETLYDHKREIVRTRLTVDAIAAHLGLKLPTEADIDAAIDPTDPDPDDDGTTDGEPRS